MARLQSRRLAVFASRHCNGGPLMAAARDQAARILRPEQDPAEGESARDAAAGPAALAESLRAHLTDETVARRPAEAPDRPAIDKPAADKPAAAPAGPANPAAP